MFEICALVKRRINSNTVIVRQFSSIYTRLYAMVGELQFPLVWKNQQFSYLFLFYGIMYLTTIECIFSHFSSQNFSKSSSFTAKYSSFSTLFSFKILFQTKTNYYFYFWSFNYLFKHPNLLATKKSILVKYGHFKSRYFCWFFF